MGVLPLQFPDGISRATLNFDGTETISVSGLPTLEARGSIQVTITRADGSEESFAALARVDTPVEIQYLRHGGILPMVLRQMA